MRSRWRRAGRSRSSSPPSTSRVSSRALSQATSWFMADYCQRMTIVWTGRPEADQLLEKDPLALLIGLVLDQQVKMEKAFSGPYELKQRLGHLDAGRIALMEPEALDAVFRERPALHRFPGNMARRVQKLCQIIASEYGGEPGPASRARGDGAELARRVPAPLRFRET